jgi:hypothetical protein
MSQMLMAEQSLRPRVYGAVMIRPHEVAAEEPKNVGANIWSGWLVNS